MTIDAEKLAQAIIDDATAAGYTMKSGHQRSTAKVVLAEMLKAVASTWIGQHMTMPTKASE